MGRGLHGTNWVGPERRRMEQIGHIRYHPPIRFRFLQSRDGSIGQPGGPRRSALESGPILRLPQEIWMELR